MLKYKVGQGWFYKDIDVEQICGALIGAIYRDDRRKWVIRGKNCKDDQSASRRYPEGFPQLINALWQLPYEFSIVEGQLTDWECTLIKEILSCYIP